MNIDITQVQRGDIVRFKSYSLRVEAEPVRGPGSITLHGRSSEDGCPLVTKRFMAGRVVEVERA
ncbi:MAG: hypothetical protein ACXWBT_14410 [Usitatibacter sp.]